MVLLYDIVYADGFEERAVPLPLRPIGGERARNTNFDGREFHSTPLPGKDGEHHWIPVGKPWSRVSGRRKK